jgi:hypothetical protein
MSLEIVRVRMLPDVYCPPSIENVAWSPAAGAFVRREPLRSHAPTFARFAFKGVVYVLAVFGLIQLIAGPH